ncbi:MAG: VWA domain-containing protein, partial [Gammaproteobacteria bacterium]|nr:VWA domain-containing protein [Gammaproteobacteria bacterium]
MARFASTLLVAVMVSSLGILGSPPRLAQGVTTPLTTATESQLRICLDENRRTKEVVDLVLLLDNSTSLNLSTGSRPTDPNETRFTAVEGMLSAIGRAIKDSSARVNFGLITFAAQSEVRIPLGGETISAETARGVAKRIRDVAPSASQKNGTNFVNALNAALQMFEQDSSSKHCRVLVWFTDGMIAHGGGTQETARLLNALPELTCGSGGFAQKVRDLGINPFVILLKP